MHIKLLKNIFLIVISIGALHLSAQIDTFYVNFKANGNNSGTSWLNAFTGLNEPLEKIKYGDEIWVAKGTYLAIDSFPFEIKTSVKMYGGFYGFENSITHRDWILNETILTIIVTPGFEYKSNVLFISNSDTTALLDGFTIQNGFAKMYIPDDTLSGDTFYNCYTNPEKFRACHGGGIYMLSESVDKPAFLNIKNCTFKYNVAYVGGAISVDAYFGSGGLNINNCFFYSNYGDERGAVSLELGEFNQYKSTITNTLFEDNHAAFSSGSLGYRSFSSDGDFLVDNTEFVNNGSGRYSGAFYNFNVNPTGTLIKNCKFINNLCWNGFKLGSGGAFYGAFANFLNCTFIGNLSKWGGAVTGASNSFLNCIFNNNKAFNNGGAIMNDGLGSINSNTIINCTFFENKAELQGGAIFNLKKQELFIYNSIFNGNKAGNSANHIFSDYIDTKIHISNIMVDETEFDSVLILNQNGPNDLVTMDTTTIFLGLPIFWDTAKADYRLAYCSPAREAGDKKWTDQYNIDIDIQNDSRVKGLQPDLGVFEMDTVISFDTLITQPTTKSSFDGEIIIENLEGLKPPIQYIWNNGIKDSINSMLKEGYYTLIVKDDLNCRDTFNFKLESSTSIINVKFLSDIKLYPNLINSSGNSILECRVDKDQKLTVLISDIIGMIIQKHEWKVNSGVNKLLLRKLKSGAYFVNVTNNENENVVLKLLVN